MDDELDTEASDPSISNEVVVDDGDDDVELSTLLPLSSEEAWLLSQTSSGLSLEPISSE